MTLTRILVLTGISASLCACLKPANGGCTDPTANNYYAEADYDDESCCYDSSCIYTYPPPGPEDLVADLYTTYSENWDEWRFVIGGVEGSVYTSYAENWDDWNFSIAGISGNISTSYAENWDDWNLTTGGYSISMETSYSENWDDWNIDDDNSAWHADVYTSYSENWDDWNAEGDSVSMSIYTSYSENWDDWNADGTFGTFHPVEFKIAVMFVPVIVTVLRIQGIIP